MTTNSGDTETSSDLVAGPLNRSASPILAALYAFALDPMTWERLVESMDGLDGPDMEAFGEHLAQAVLLHKSSPIRSDHVARPGLVQFDAKLIILDINAKGQEALNRLGCVGTQGQRLEFPSPDNAFALGEAVKRTGSNGHDSTLVQLRDDNDQILICVVRAPEADLNYPGAFHLAVSTLPDTEASAELVRVQLALTNAESAMAARLGTGMTLTEIAADLSISVHTARSHLRSIFRKLGINRQSELVRLVVELGSLHGEPAQARRPGAVIEDLPERQSFALADGRVITFREFGDPGGLPIIFFHNGFGLSSLGWSSAAMLIAKGMRGFHLERPGFGMSSIRPDYTVDGVAADLAEVIDGMGFASVAFMASAGGMPFALATAPKIKTALSKVCIINGRPGDGGETTPHAMLPTPTRFFSHLKKHPLLAGTFSSIVRSTFQSRRGGDFLASILLKSHENLSVVHQEVYQKQTLRGLREAMVKTAKGMTQEFACVSSAPAVSIARFPCPLHIWHGEKDNFIPVEEMRAYADTCSAATLKIVPGMGHELHPDVWDEICNELVTVRQV